MPGAANAAGSLHLEAMRTLHILVPGLFWPDLRDDRVYADLHLPRVAKLLGKGRMRRVTALGLEGWLARTWGYASGTPPFAALLARSTGDDPAATWICADPVHLQPRGAELFLTAGHLVGLEDAESAALVEALNSFFAEDGISFHAVVADRWVARIARPPRMQTVPVSVAHGRPVDPLLPRGDEAMAWVRRLNEAQMLLHAHPVNEAREMRGSLPVNSVWFWGAGAFEPPPRKPFESVFSDDLLVRAVASASGVAAATLPGNMQDVLSAVARGETLLHYPACARAAETGDVDAWRAAVVSLDTDCLAPALAALTAGLVDRVELTGLAGRRGVHASLGRLDGLRFWRRAALLSHRLLGTDQAAGTTAA